MYNDISTPIPVKTPLSSSTKVLCQALVWFWQLTCQILSAQLICCYWIFFHLFSSSQELLATLLLLYWIFFHRHFLFFLLFVSTCTCMFLTVSNATLPAAVAALISSHLHHSSAHNTWLLLCPSLSYYSWIFSKNDKNTHCDKRKMLSKFNYVFYRCLNKLYSEILW